MWFVAAVLHGAVCFEIVIFDEYLVYK